MQGIIKKKLSSNQVYLGTLQIQDQHLLQISCEHAQSIKQLWLSIIQGYKVNNRLTHNGIYYISLMPWNNLAKLGIWNNRIGCKGCKFITNMKLHSLQYLNISENFIENAGVSHLVKIQSKNLKYLDLSNNLIDTKSIRMILKGNWKWLRQLSLWKNNLKTKEDLLDLVLLQIRGIQLITINNNPYIRGIDEARQLKKLYSKLQSKFGFQKVAL